jgi:biopolymer transport protein ExbD
MDEKEFDQLNVIPLVDVMLVLLAIVLTTSTFIAKGLIPVNLPRASGSRAAALPRLTIELDRSGAASMGGVALTPAALARRLETAPRSTPVLIRSDRDLRLQSFIDLLDLVKGLGFSQVSVQTETVPPGP